MDAEKSASEPEAANRANNVPSLKMVSAPSHAAVTVNNITNTRAPLYPSNSGIPGLFYPTLPFYDDMGRYYTIGIRARF